MRKPISQKIRFEIFKRDSFTCQYCGKKAPDVVLEVDHIKPVSKKGTNEILNLITACFDCNRGKSKNNISDNSVIEKQRNELSQMQERRTQMNLMIKWKNELLKNEDKLLNDLVSKYALYAAPYSLTPDGKNKLRTVLKKVGYNILFDSICDNVSIIKYNKENEATDVSVELYFDNVLKNALYKQQYSDMPFIKDVHYLRKILINNHDIQDWHTKAYIKNILISLFQNTAEETWIILNKDIKATFQSEPSFSDATNWLLEYYHYHIGEPYE